jgi:phosphosulfolactate synthase (CoM biosynthesis protein A)
MKRQRVAYVVSELVRRNGEADLKEFMGSIAINYGIRKKTQEEYFEDLKYAGAIDVMEGSKIVLKWDIDKAKEWLRKQEVTL